MGDRLKPHEVSLSYLSLPPPPLHSSASPSPPPSPSFLCPPVTPGLTSTPGLTFDLNCQPHRLTATTSLNIPPHRVRSTLSATLSSTATLNTCPQHLSSAPVLNTYQSSSTLAFPSPCPPQFMFSQPAISLHSTPLPLLPLFYPPTLHINPWTIIKLFYSLASSLELLKTRRARSGKSRGRRGEEGETGWGRRYCERRYWGESGLEKSNLTLFADTTILSTPCSRRNRAAIFCLKLRNLSSQFLYKTKRLNNHQRDLTEGGEGGVEGRGRSRGRGRGMERKFSISWFFVNFEKFEKSKN